MSEGAEAFLSLHELLNEHVEKTTKHIDDIGERVARLGGVPTAHPVTQHELSYIKHEVEGQLGDFGTVEVLEDVLVEREDLGYHLYSTLEDDTLVRGMTHLLDGQNDMAGNRPMSPNSKLQ